MMLEINKWTINTNFQFYISKLEEHLNLYNYENLYLLLFSI